MLERSSAFQQLSEEKRREIAHDTVKVAAYLTAPEGIPANTLSGAVIVVPPQGLAAAVDFPTFVAGLVNGVFAAVVDATKQQMDAYAALMKDAAATVETFERDSTKDPTEVQHSARQRIAASRQQLLATMVLMGINRIVVTDGKAPMRS
jgi:hypothetical protein